MDGLFIFGAMLLVYLLPGIIASNRGHRNASAIFVANLLLGWMLIPWALCLVWAFLESRETATA